ncbi:Holliday junction resolvase RuvX [Riemerella anatipestifer]|uniref:Putative pre-16S rRNA nuclease n=1 Tax=Riemerella anatipestifer TaxID=34085 RepID=A0A1S7DTR9_RIEAN|nr:Holliday junction resolvase RuvX [Riemerella anatipestifer]AQY22506.1 Putative Holliday junction resolvase [Riemerella anatipestifer]MCO7352358.1 Holliday junction resolvase RuvX [Riemerella anatipestifer]MCT6764378.1 Holliday junction resolvase RuvX [Riemerella anatipestifer]MCT6766586.1 Holliday junction resolvase RuvX [Riemerella anatipestifer]MCT6768558.1 Holliday junction resolvase RuvX [Riemerella anatipestifer]
MGQILAIDYGKARTGIAATDDMKLIASGLATVPTGELLLFLSEYIRSNVVEAVVVGYPVDLKGNVSEVETSILEFIEKFNTQFPEIEVRRLDERFTSKMASFFISQSGKNKKQRQEKGLIDKVSATIILQNFLDQKR